MKNKKIISAALSLLLAFGSFTALPGSMPLSSGIQASATEYLMFESVFFDGSLLSKLNNFTVTPESAGAKVSWGGYSGAAEYYVMYGTPGSTLFSVFDKVKTTSCTITGLKENTSYCFAIVAFDSNSNPIASAYVDNISTKSANGASSASSNSDFVIKTDKNGQKYIAEYKGKGGDITLPKGVYVGEGAFKNNKTITSITSPGGHSFEESAFENCPNLKSITVKGNLSIGAKAFRECVNLQSVTIEGSITDGIGHRAFAECNSLKNFTVKKNTSEYVIGQYAFYDCYSLESFNIPSKCTEIYDGAFLNCFSLDKVTIPSKTKIITTSDEYYPAFGYFYAGKSEEDIWDGKYYSAVSDGKTSVYCDYFNTTTGVTLENDLLLDYKKFTPKKLTMIVAKGSDAERYAKEKKVAYEYASSSSSDKLTAPKNLKATKKTANSISVSWSAVDGADKYAVYLLNSKTGKYEKYTTVSGTKCTIKNLKKNTSYKIKVAAIKKVNGKNKSGTASKPITVKTNSK